MLHRIIKNRIRVGSPLIDHVYKLLELGWFIYEFADVEDKEEFLYISDKERQKSTGYFENQGVTMQQ